MRSTGLRVRMPWVTCPTRSSATCSIAATARSIAFQASRLNCSDRSSRDGAACRPSAIGLDPPLNDLWTIPGEEARLSAFQAEDRGHFRAIDPTYHYHALQIRDFLCAVRDGREPAVTVADGRAVRSEEHTSELQSLRH